MFYWFWLAQISNFDHVIISKPITDSVANQHFIGLIVAEHKAYIFQLNLMSLK